MVKPGGPAEHLLKSAAFLRAVRVLLGAGLADRAASDAYYAAFHAAQALLATAGLAAETQGGVHTLLARHFVKDGPLPASLRPRSRSSAPNWPGWRHHWESEDSVPGPLR